jgi:hypothetical protein
MGFKKQVINTVIGLILPLIVISGIIVAAGGEVNLQNPSDDSLIDEIHNPTIDEVDCGSIGYGLSTRNKTYEKPVVVGEPVVFYTEFNRPHECVGMNVNPENSYYYDLNNSLQWKLVNESVPRYAAKWTFDKAGTYEVGIYYKVLDPKYDPTAPFTEDPYITNRAFEGVTVQPADDEAPPGGVA